MGSFADDFLLVSIFVMWPRGVVVSALTSHVRGARVVTMGKFLYTNFLC